MKKLFIFATAVLLGACSSAPVMHSSFNGQNFTSAPTSKSDPRLGHPTFYRDEGDNAWWTHDVRPAR